MAEEALVRIFHLSDLRFTADAGWWQSPLTTGLAEFARALVREGLAPDLLAITGNAAADRESFEPAIAGIGGRLLGRRSPLGEQQMDCAAPDVATRVWSANAAAGVA